MKLITGDPFRQRPGWVTSTFTRFALPFAYDLTPWREASPPTVYAPLRSGGRRDGFPGWERRAYFTRETASVLFDRALWLQLSRADEPGGVLAPFQFDVNYRGRRIRTCVEPPTIVLFEHASHEVEPPFNEHARRLLWCGFLLFDLWWPEDADLGFNELLAINELFRYWRMPFPSHAAQSGYHDILKNAPYSPHRFVGGEPIGNKGERPYHERWLRFLRDAPVRLNGQDYRLFPSDWDCPDGKETWATYADNRAFVWTCAVVPGGFGALTPPDEPSRHGRWIKLLNVDPPTDWWPAGATTFEQEWADGKAYTRWLHFGTVYGFNYHAGAMLADECDNPPLSHHFATMYWDQVMLLLYVRIGAFRFSTALSSMSERAFREKEHELAHQFSSLRGSFALFTNLYRFPLLSNQQQGVELYEKARRGLDVEELFREVDQELAAMHNYVEMIAQRRGNEVQTSLTVVATAAIIVALASGLLELWANRPAALGIRAWLRSLASKSVFWFLLAFLLVTVLAWLGGPLARLWQPRAKGWWRRLDKARSRRSAGRRQKDE